jgi:hypothetical protein
MMPEEAKRFTLVAMLFPSAGSRRRRLVLIAINAVCPAKFPHRIGIAVFYPGYWVHMPRAAPIRDVSSMFDNI